jgi:hypothetical protein
MPRWRLIASIRRSARSPRTEDHADDQTGDSASQRDAR